MIDKIITGAGHSLSKEMAEKYKIELIPYPFLVDNTNYLEGDISVSDFLEKLKKIKKSSDFPKTSALTVESIVESFKKFPKENNNVFCLMMSKEMTKATYMALKQAKQASQRPEVEIIDTRQVAMGKDLIVLEIAKFIEAQKTKDEIMEFSKQVVASTNSIIAMPNLKYLYYGGRIGKAKTLMGSLLRVIPLIAFRDQKGIVDPLGKAKKVSQANQKMVEQIKTEFTKKQGSKIKCLIGNVDNQAAEDNLKQQLAENFGNDIEISQGKIGCVATCYMGPESWGVGYNIK